MPLVRWPICKFYIKYLIFTDYLLKNTFNNSQEFIDARLKKKHFIYFLIIQFPFFFYIVFSAPRPWNYGRGYLGMDGEGYVQ